MDMLITLVIILGVIILIMFSMYISAKRNDKQYIDTLNKNFGKLNNKSSINDINFSNIDAYYLRHKSFGQIDDTTFKDLNLSEIISFIDKTESDLGRQLLYHMLRTPNFEYASITNRQKSISYWRDNIKERSSVLLALHHYGHSKRFDLYDCFEGIKTLKEVNPIKYFLLPFCLILSIASLFFTEWGIFVFIFMLIHNMVIYYKDKTKIGPYVNALNKVIVLINSATDIVSTISSDSNESTILGIKSELEHLSKFKRKNGVLNNYGGEGNLFVLVLKLIGSIFYTDLIRFYRMKKILVLNIESVDRLITYVGEIDALICIANYVESLGDNICEPQFFDDNSASKIKVTNLYHPLVKNPVPNSIETDNSILLTGANASGKSTFLKALGLSVLFAQAFGFVLANEYYAPIYQIKSSMSISDNVADGDSYYMAEIKSVKRIIDDATDAKDKGIKTIAFIDELLRGTNTIERIAAAAQILKYLDDENLFVCGATHDLELTELLKGYINYHFEEDLSDGDVRFLYELKTGPAQSRNAIRLLKTIGFDEGIVNAADNMVANYEKNQTWILD